MADNPSRDTSLQSTKQMLDELDALMERMLSLPINELGEPGTNPPKPGKGPSLTASLTLLDTDKLSADDTDMRLEPLSANAVPMAPPSKTVGDGRRLNTPHPSVQPPHMKQPAEPAKPAPNPPTPLPAPAPLTNEVIPASILPTIEPLLQQVSPQRSYFPILLATVPILWINQTYDKSTMPLGEFGSWLRGSGTRTLLGFTGIVLMVIGAVWILKDWLGWNL